MDVLGNNTALNNLLPEGKCRIAVATNAGTIAMYALGFFISVFLSNALHALLRPLSQPRIISEFIVGLFVSNLPIVRKHALNSPEGRKTIDYIADVGMIFHMFVLGLEIDPKILFRPSLREIKVASTGMVLTFILALLVFPYLKIFDVPSSKLTYSLCILLSGTASPLLTRIITDLKIGKSDIGRFVVSVGIQSDLVSILLLSLGSIVYNPLKSFELRDSRNVLSVISFLVFQTVIAANLTPILMNWVNNENPEGKPMKGSHFILHSSYVVFICSISVMAEFNTLFSVFIAGVFMPSEGRIAKMMISKINYLLSSIFYPLFFLWVGAEGDVKQFGARDALPWARLFAFFATATVGKVAGTVLSGLVLGFHWPELVAIGLLLNTKGHFHVYLAISAAKFNVTTISTSMAMIFATFLTIIYTPMVVASIIKRARRRSPMQRMALQWLDPSSELRILLGLHGPLDVPSAITTMEISRGPPHPGLMVYTTDMVELTDKIAATLTQGEGIDKLTVTDQAVIDMREKITSGLQGYLNEESEGISLRQMHCIASINSMHQDICNLAEDLLVSLIILPFHKDLQADGRLNLGHSGFRHVNRKVLRHAPCSVGILVDRGLGSISKISRSSATLNAAVIFIGGKDDREALAFAGRVARHPGVKLTVIRFILESNSDTVSTRVRRRFNTAQQQEEMKLDDEFFAEFYDRHVARSHVAYMEKYLVNSGQTFSTLQSLEGQYGLFIVGQGGRVNSVLTVGMNDWEECPELGPIGDILSTSEFSVTASVLIIQQHSIRGELDGLDDEFSIMKM